MTLLEISLAMFDFVGPFLMRTTDFRKIREEFIRIGIQVIGESSEGIG